MNDMFSRYAVLAGVFTWGAAGLILPMVRHRLKTGDGTGFVLQQVTDRGRGKTVGDRIDLEHVNLPVARGWAVALDVAEVYSRGGFVEVSPISEPINT